VAGDGVFFIISSRSLFKVVAVVFFNAPTPYTAIDPDKKKSPVTCGNCQNWTFGIGDEDECRLPKQHGAEHGDRQSRKESYAIF